MPIHVVKHLTYSAQPTEMKWWKREDRKHVAHFSLSPRARMPHCVCLRIQYECVAFNGETAGRQATEYICIKRITSSLYSIITTKRKAAVGHKSDKKVDFVIIINSGKSSGKRIDIIVPRCMQCDGENAHTTFPFIRTNRRLRRVMPLHGCRRHRRILFIFHVHRRFCMLILIMINCVYVYIEEWMRN